MMEKAELRLENGLVFEGESLGANGKFSGELVFLTAMTGYQEAITDPSYLGQGIVFTVPHVGNVGVNWEDEQSLRVCCEGIITRSLSRHFSNWRAKEDLGTYMKKHNKFAISGIDTRALTQILRQEGPMKFSVTTKGSLVNDKKGNNRNAQSGIKSFDSSYLPAFDQPEFHVVVVDFGVKSAILESLRKCGLSLSIVSPNVSFSEIQALDPDGIVLSNGPGDPSQCENAIELIKHIIASKIPTFGICLGHQLLALASGAQIYKMEVGHHGINHPIFDLETNRVHISSQNHCFAVLEESLPNSLVLTHRSLFDGTVAGFKGKEAPILSFQGHPEGGPGPNDLEFLFHSFANLLRKTYAKAM